MIGQRVQLKKECLGNYAGTVGVCYETYNLGGHLGASFIFSNGEYCGFSEAEQKEFFDVLDTVPLTYNFTNVLQLTKDFESGFFMEYF